ncbi:hypothetical protein [Hoeflea sp. 108]|jgi:hypothetical protein|uniref:hypothetical protein n=1 Tax=Hoeflea sp. 108 TaxID=1116369 RepID=UPI0012F9BED9|nr:hypothetical protein [Hoeflea sp. 108]
MQRISIVCLLSLASVTLAHGEDVALRGIMTGVCSRIFEGVKETDDLKNPRAIAMISWAQGYISANNVGRILSGAHYRDIGSLSALELWASMFGYCQRNPTKTGLDAVIHAEELMQSKPPS